VRPGNHSHPCYPFLPDGQVTLSAAITLPVWRPPKGLPVAVSPPRQEQHTTPWQLLAIPM
jgi:hypothetical protein